MIVVHLTTVHPRYDGRIFLKECASLVKRFSVYVVVADGRGDETKNNIRILDIGSSKNRWHRIFFKTFAMLTKAFKLKADVYHLHDSELLPVGVVLKIFGKKVIYDAHENLSATVSYKQYIPIYLRGCVGFLVKNIEKLSVCFFDGLVAANQSIGNQFKLHKTYIVPNYTINNEFKESVAVKKKYGVKLCYVGGISEIRGICQLVDALYGTKVELILAGPFESDELKQRVMASAGWKNVDYRGTVSREEVCRIYSSSSAGVITFLPHPNHDACSPNKLYEYLSAGLPVICSNFTGFKGIVEESQCGVAVNPASVDEIRQAMLFMINNPDKREAMSKAASRISEKYTWSHCEPVLFNCYDKVLRR